QDGRSGRIAVPARARGRLLPPRAGRGHGDLCRLDGDVGGVREGLRSGAVELAMWDAFGKACGQPLHRLLGGTCRTSIEIAAYVFSNDAAKVAASARDFRQRGFTTVKLKIGYDEASDIALTRAVRD